jgi:glycerate 2-kinase
MEQALLSQIYSRHREILLDLYQESMAELSPEILIQRYVKLEKRVLTIGNREYFLGSTEKIFVIGSGKASGTMALALEKILGHRIADGIVLVNRGFPKRGSHIQFFESDHPTPTVSSYSATLEIIAFLKSIPAKSIVINLISGGTSSLLYAPPIGIELNSVASLWNLLLDSGASIEEINTVRKQLSQVHGGRLLRLTKNFRLVDLILSDVPGNNPSVIGSGPTTIDETTIDDALEILKNYDLIKKLPTDIADYLFNRLRFNDSDKPKIGSDSLLDHQQYIIGTSTDLAGIIAEKAKQKKFGTRYSKQAYSGSSKEIAIQIAKDSIAVLNGQISIKKPAILIYHGESYVSVTGTGKGGRNQELALTAALALEGQHKISLLSLGTDGKDGPTDVAGAAVNGLTTLRARKKDFNPEEYLRNNDSYSFFSAFGDTIRTEKNVTNLMDIQLILIEA